MLYLLAFMKLRSHTLPIIMTLALLLWSGMAQAGPALDGRVESSYQAARQCYYQLLNAPAEQKRRDRWDRCIRAFLQIASEAPASHRAPDALFSAAKATEQLFQSSKSPDDLKRAIDRYTTVAKRHPTSRLADDALYRAGVVYWEGLHDRAAAARVMKRLVRNHPDGDMRVGATAFLKRLDREQSHFHLEYGLLPVEPVPTARIAARTGLIRTSALPAPTTTLDRPCHIVLDPGHGGKDPGARGPQGTLEKAVTLGISHKVTRILKQRLGCRVTLTRSKDRTLTLDERNRIANRKKADLFLSIHANASTSSAQHGIQTYFLNNASDKASAKLAARENASAGKSLGDLEHIVSTMLQNAFTEESQRLAGHVQRALVDRLKTKYSHINDQRVRSALFYVLVGAKSPAILVETSYISHPREERRLQTHQYQAAVATGIVDGVERFFKERSRRATL
jgi:N-acetylmuramoyl-L-alanine amidase